MNENKANQEEPIKRESGFRRGDLYLLLSMFLVAGVLFLVFRWKGQKPGEYVRATVDGEKYGEYFLDKDQEIIISTARGENRFCIRDGKVDMLSADCPDKYCVKHKGISKQKETIVCLPHRVVLEVISGVSDGDTYDVITGSP